MLAYLTEERDVRTVSVSSDLVPLTWRGDHCFPVLCFVVWRLGIDEPFLHIFSRRFYHTCTLILSPPPLAPQENLPICSDPQLSIRDYTKLQKHKFIAKKELFSRLLVSIFYLRDSSVGVVTRLHAKWSEVQILAGGKRFFSFSKRPYDLHFPPVFVCDGYRLFFPVGKAAAVWFWQLTSIQSRG